MSLICRVRGHRPVDLVWNEGRHFSTCERCGAEIVRGRSPVWRTPAAGERIVHPGDGGPPRLVR